MTLSQPTRTGRPLTIAIDGPAGAGKSTLAKIVANRLGYLYVDTGAMYRALTLKALRLEIPLTDSDALTQMAGTTLVRLERSASGGNRVFLDGTEVTAEIRDPIVERAVSRVSSVIGLRTYMIQLQREIGARGGVVMDGRDIGSHVLPKADLKFFVTASLTERALRRQQQQSQAGHQRTLWEIEAEIAQRDEVDRNKGEHSLVQMPDSILIDTTDRSVEDVITQMLAYCRRD